MRPDAAWMKRRGCRGMDPGPWFSTQRDEIVKAKAVCDDCPVKTVCLSWQLEYEGRLRQVDPGMFGGVTPAERREMLGLRPLGRPGRKPRPGLTPTRVLELLEHQPQSEQTHYYETPRNADHAAVGVGNRGYWSANPSRPWGTIS